LIKIKISCHDEYESTKLGSLIFIKEGKETFITKILDVIDNEIIVSLKDKSAHSVLLKDKSEVEIFVDFIQSVIEKKHEIIDTMIFGKELEIVKN